MITDLNVLNVAKRFGTALKYPYHARSVINIHKHFFKGRKNNLQYGSYSKTKVQYFGITLVSDKMKKKKNKIYKTFIFLNLRC